MCNINRQRHSHHAHDTKRLRNKSSASQSTNGRKKKGNWREIFQEAGQQLLILTEIHIEYQERSVDRHRQETDPTKKSLFEILLKTEQQSNTHKT